MTIQTSDIFLDVDGGPVKAYIAKPEAGGPGVLVLHAWWGLKPFFKELCDRLAEQGFTALAPDLRQGQIAQTIEEAKQLMENSDQQAVGDAVMAAKDYLLAHANGDQIGVVGFSMGGSWALVVAGYDPEHIAGTVLFYGVGETEFNKVQSKVLGHFSDSDEWEPMDGIRWLEGSLKDAGVDSTFHIYPKLQHWFMEEDRPEYDAAAAQQAWERTYDFLHDVLDEKA